MMCLVNSTAPYAVPRVARSRQPASRWLARLALRGAHVHDADRHELCGDAPAVAHDLGHVGHRSGIDLHERPARLRGLADAVLVARRPHRRTPRLHDVWNRERDHRGGIRAVRAIVRLRPRAVHTRLIRVGWDVYDD